jgi:hypothetical protein
MYHNTEITIFELLLVSALVAGLRRTEYSEVTNVSCEHERNKFITSFGCILKRKCERPS